MQAEQKIPSVREFALELRVNPNTIQRAYMELERQELNFSKIGMGNFVTEDTQKITSLFNIITQEKVTRFIQETADIGFSVDQ